MATKIDAELVAELESLAAASGCELVHCEFKGGVLRLFIDRPDGVTLEDCEHVSRQASALLDVADFGSSRYTLEVSSPGLDRPLRRAADYERFRGQEAALVLREKQNDTRKVRGVLGGLDGANALVETADGTVSVPLDNIERARLVPKIEWRRDR